MVATANHLFAQVVLAEISRRASRHDPGFYPGCGPAQGDSSLLHKLETSIKGHS